ncbi:MAG: hypothetical protein PHD48_11525, partial [Alphaproteobacteria bacterium]|nr:hypothetical protein [Alphaproteobacteria bacterium]
MKTADETPTDIFKRATATTIKAIGHRAELEVAFAPGGESFSNDRIKLPELAEHLSQEEMACSRGRADAAAVRLRYHDPTLPASHRPLPPQAFALLTVLEQARCEALGAQKLAGLGSNIGAYLETQCQQKDFLSAKSQADVPLSDVIHLVAHERLGGQKIPPVAAKAVALWRPVIEDRLAPHFIRLKNLLHDQQAFTAEVEDLLVTLNLVEKEAQESQTATDSDKPQDAPKQPTPDEQTDEQKQ